jgi:hypothetical protein
VSPENVDFWNARYPGRIPERLVVADKLEGNVFRPRGQRNCFVCLAQYQWGLETAPGETSA